MSAKKIKKNPVVIMFHTVGLNKLSWSYPWISLPPAYFEGLMKTLKRFGYKTLFFGSDMSNQGKEKSVVFTFDDGYLDNWVHVFPILKQYGFKATVFVTTDFVDPADTIRPQVQPETFEEHAHSVADCCAGFLSWQEMREMEKSGLVDIQCHAVTHTWYFKGPRIVDYWHPGSATEEGGPIWMLWNRFPEFKPYYLTKAAEYESKIPYGTPIYEHDKSLATKRYFPDRLAEQRLTEYVAQNGGTEFFNTDNWKEKLDHFAQSENLTDDSNSSYETDEDYYERIKYELTESKKILEKKLNKKITALCWPGGGVTERVLQMARDIGFSRFTLPNCLAKYRREGGYEDCVDRMAFIDQVSYGNIKLGKWSSRQFLWLIRRHAGSNLYKWLIRLALLKRLSIEMGKRVLGIRVQND